MRERLHKKAGIPVEEITGMRAPFLQVSVTHSIGVKENLRMASLPVECKVLKRRVVGMSFLLSKTHRCVPKMNDEEEKIIYLFK